MVKEHIILPVSGQWKLSRSEQLAVLTEVPLVGDDGICASFRLEL